jgi:hypothetical protein
MDLFNLVARLTIDSDEYEKRLRQAENAAKSFDGDVEGTIELNDEYSSAIEEAEAAAAGFDGDASGTLTGTDDYTDEEEAAQESADEFDGDEEGTLEGTDEYSEVEGEAQQSADSFDGDEEGTLTGKDEYSDDESAAQKSADAFDCDKEGTLSGTDEYSSEEGKAQKSADSFDGDKEGTLSGTDEYSTAESAAQKSADTFDGDVEGTILGTDDYSEEEEAAQASADDFDGDVDGTLTGVDSYTEEEQTAQESADSFDGDRDAELKLDIQNFLDGILNAESSAQGFETTFGGITENLAAKLTAAGITAGIKAISDAFQEAIQSAATYADTVDKGSRSLSMSTDTYQVWQHALQQSGTDISAVSRGWLNLTDAIDTAKNHQEEWAEDTGDVKKALEQIGVNPKNFESVDAMFDSVVTQLAKLESGAKRDALVTALFGRGGNALNALLDSGVQGIEDLKKEAYDLGLVMSGEDINAGVAYGDAIANMNAAVEALKQNIVSGLFPLLTDAANMITQIVAFFNGRTHEKDINEWFSDIDQNMADAFAQANSDEITANSLISTLKSMSDETGKCSENLGVWQGIAEKLIEICPNLKNQIDLVNGTFTEQKQTLEEATQAWFDNARAQAVTTALQDKQAALAKKSGDIVGKQVEMLAKQSEAEDRIALARKKANEAISKAGYSEMKGFTPEDIAGYDSEQLWKRLNLLSNSARPAWDKGGEELQSAITQAGDAAQLFQEAAELSSDIEELETALANATEEYQSYANAANDYLKKIQDGINAIPDKKTVTIELVDNTGEVDLKSHAKGLNYVPYDGYVAELHRGEMVLNQGQSRRLVEGGIDTKSIANAVSEAIGKSMQGMAINMDGSAVGNVVTSQVSKNLASQMKSRRYT